MECADSTDAGGREDSRVQTPSHSPNCNAHAERFVCSVRRVSQRDDFIGGAHIRRALHEFVERYHGERNYQKLGTTNSSPSPRLRIALVGFAVVRA
jgi:hypothetical protein